MTSLANLSLRRSALALALAAVLPVTLAQSGNASLTLPGLAQPLYPLSSPDQVPAAQKPQVFKASEPGPVNYSVNESAARLVVNVARNAVPADGQTPVAVSLHVLGADGLLLGKTVWATVESSGGRIQLPGAATDEAGPRGRDADRATPGVQVEVKNGVASFSLLAPMTPQDVLLRVTVGAQSASGVVSFVPELRDMVAAGLVEGVINFHGKRSGVLQATRFDDGFEREITAWSREFNNGRANIGARAALFLKGTVKGEYLLTAAYDSDKETRARALRDISPEEFYPVYGDASLKGMDAKSDSRLYVRIDQQKNYLLWGDFATGDGFSQQRGGGAVASLQQRSLGNTNRSATGVRYHHEEGAVTGNVFAFRDTLRQVVEEFTSQGSGPYGLRNNAVLEGSEKIEVLVRDRNQPSRILSARALARLADYTFEPFSGRILLNAFLPSTDADLNPQSLRVSYEVDQGGTPFWVLGADGQWRLNSQLEVGGSVMKDENPLAPAQLVSANVGWQLAPKTLLVAEVARSTGEYNTNSVNASTQPGLIKRVGEVSGNAWRVELAHESESADLRAFVGRSDPEFSNLAAPLNGGRGEANVRGTLKLSETLKAYAQVQRSEDRNPGAADSSAAQLGLTAKLSPSLTLDVGLRALRESAGTTSNAIASPFSSTAGLTSSIGSGSAGGAVGFGNQLLDPATGLPIIQPGNSIAGGATATTSSAGLHSNSLRAGLGFKASERFTLGGEVERSVSGDERERYALGGDYTLAERTRLYGRFERQTGVAGSDLVTPGQGQGNAFVFGVDSSYLRDTQLFSEYRLRDAIAGRDLQLASGVRNSWDLAPGWRANTALERTQVVSGQSADTSAVALGLDYSAHPLWKGSTKIEWRRSGDIAGTVDDESFTTTLWQIMAARKLDRDWTFLGRNYLLKTDYTARGDVFQDRVQLGLAYRDTDTNRVNALGKIEFKNERDASSATLGELKSQATILSTHADWHPTRPWWLTGRLAAKWQNDQFEGGVKDSFRAQLLSGRLVYDVTENWDIGAMLATQFGQFGARQSANGVELGYLVRQNLWLSLGYNRSGFAADADLAGYEYTQSGVYLRLRFKFDENLFMHDNPGVNRSLDRATSGAKP
jgi:hypothetical protein